MQKNNSTSKTKFEIIVVNGTEFTVDVSMLQKSEDMFFNATEIAKQYNKKPIDWINSKQANDYINVILKVENFHLEDLVRTVHGGKHNGTWLHKKLALPFARWCSVEFEYLLDRWIESKIAEERTRKIEREKLKTGYLPLTEAIKNSQTEPQFYHYSNAADMLNRLVTGMSAKQYKLVHNVNNVRDNFSVEENKLMDTLQRQLASLKELGFEDQECKRILSDYVSKSI